MAEFIINPQSANFETIKQEIIDFLDAQPDANKWTLFFESPSGQNLIEIAAALGTFYKYDIITARREAYLQHALNRSSQIGGAQYNGYSIFRGRNALLNITFTPSGTGIYPKYHILGTVKDRDMILLTETPYNLGVPLTVQVAIGSLSEEALLAPDSNLNVFRFTQKGVSDDLRIFIDSVEATVSESMIDLINDKFVLQSNPVGSVDAKYLNALTATPRYNAGSEIKLQWIDLKNITFDLSNVELDETEGTLTASEIADLYKDPESETSIKINAPLSNEVKQVIRARNDQHKQILSLDTSIIDANGEDISGAEFRVFTLRENRILFTQVEKDALQDAFEIHRPHGVKPPEIADPTRLNIKLKVDIVLSGIVGDTVTNTNALIDPLEDDLGGKVDIQDLEASIEALSSVKIARIVYDGDDWAAATKYEIGKMVKASPDTGRIYEVLEILYFSDGVEPTWPVVANDTIVDGDVVWKAIPKDDVAGFTAWAATTIYRVGDQVKPTVANSFIYEVVETQNESDASEPTWTPLSGGLPEDIQGSLVSDGDILWIATPQEGTPSAWVASTVYKKGDVIVATDQSASDTIGVMFQAFAYLGTSDAAQPTFPTTLDLTVDDINLRWITKDPAQIEKEAGPGEYFVIDRDITVT